MNRRIKLAVGGFVILLFLIGFGNPGMPITRISASPGYGLIWEQNMASLGDWTNCNGDQDWDSGGDWDYDVEIEDSLVTDGWTPYDYSTRSNFWTYKSDYYYAGVYREESHLTDDEWEFMTKIYCDLGYQGTSFSCGGSMRIVIYDAERDPLFRVRIHDGSSTNNRHRTRGRAGYWDSGGTYHNTIQTSYADIDINSDNYGIRLTADNNYEVYFPSLIPSGYGGTWSTICTEAQGESRGTPTYITLEWHMWYEAPVDAHITEMEFYGETELIANGDFETGAITPWYGDPSEYCEIGISNNAHSGDYAAYVIDDRYSGPVYIHQDLDLDSIDWDDLDTLSFWIKTAGFSGGYEVRLGTSNSWIYCGWVYGTWEQRTVSDFSGYTGDIDKLSIRVNRAYTTGTFYVDDVVLTLD